MWLVLANAQLPEEPQIYSASLFAADGTVVLSFPVALRGADGVEFLSPALGVWEPYNGHTGHFTATQSITDIEGNVIRVVTIDGHPQASDDGNTFIDDGSLVTVTIRDNAGEVIAVVPSGTPVAPSRLSAWQLGCPVFPATHPVTAPRWADASEIPHQKLLSKGSISMTNESTAHALSRRRAMLGIGGGGMALLAERLVAIAQEATPEDVTYSRVDHPLLGAWQWNMNLNFDRDTPIAVLTRSGEYLEFDLVAGLGVGFWRATGEDSGECFAQYQDLAGTWQRIAGPEEILEPGYQPQTFTYQREIVTTRTTLRLRPDGAGIIQTGTFSAYVANGTNAYTTGMSRTGIRLVPAG